MMTEKEACKYLQGEECVQAEEINKIRKDIKLILKELGVKKKYLNGLSKELENSKDEDISIKERLIHIEAQMQANAKGKETDIKYILIVIAFLNVLMMIFTYMKLG